MTYRLERIKVLHNLLKKYPENFEARCELDVLLAITRNDRIVKDLFTPLFHQRIVPDKTKYNRKKVEEEE